MSSQSTEDLFQTGWIRDTTNTSTEKSSWEDYVILNRFTTKYGMSLQAGNDLLELFQELASRHAVKINLPKTMRSIRLVSLCFLM